MRLVQAHAEQSSQYISLHYDDGEFDIKELKAAQTARYAAEVELGLMVPSANTAIEEARKSLWKLDETEQEERTPGTRFWADYDTYEKARGQLEDLIREVLAVDTVPPKPRLEIEA